MNFSDWLIKHHPNVHLHSMQQAWVEAHERGERPLWVGGKASGKTFVAKLYQEFTDQQKATLRDS